MKKITIATIAQILAYITVGTFIVPFIYIPVCLILDIYFMNNSIFIYIFLGYFILPIILIVIMSIDNALEKKHKNVLFEIDKKTYKKLKKIGPVLLVVSIPIIVLISSLSIFIDNKLLDKDNSNIIYSAGKKPVSINHQLDFGVGKNNYRRIKSSVFLGHELENNYVVKQYVCFVKNKKVICIEGYNSDVYLANSKKIIDIFGEENCSYAKDNVFCSDGNLVVSVNKRGVVKASNKKKTCEVNKFYTTSCYNKK